jgi:hypothetical protein
MSDEESLEDVVDRFVHSQASMNSSAEELMRRKLSMRLCLQS